jgi:hypothetical protein
MAVGVYQSSQRFETNFLKVLALVGQLAVDRRPDGTLTAGSALGLDAKPRVLREITPGVFRAETGAPTAFVANTAHGGVTMQVSPPALEFHRVAWHQNARLIVPLVAASFLIALLTVMAWPAAAYLRRRRGAVFGRDPSDRKSFVFIRLVALLHVAVLGTMIGAGLWIGGDVSKLDGRLDPALAVLFALAWLGVLGAPAAAVMAFSLIQNRVGGRWSRIHHALLALAGLVLGWFFVAYNIAGTTLRY